MTPRSLFAPARLAGQPILRTQSDERLVDLVRAGSEPAFEAIVGRYRRPLMRYCARILPEERAEDVVQQTFLRAYDSMRQSGAELSLRPWLYRIAHNTALNALRDRGLRHEELDEAIDGVERPDQALERSQGLRAVVTAVQGLPERQRDAIVLRELEGRSYDEIAVELGVSGGAVRQLLNRARHNLRAAVTAVTPTGLALRVPWSSSDPVGVRVAELCDAGGAGAVMAKVCATALVTGAVVGGAATVQESTREEPAAAESAAGGSGSPGGSGGGPGRAWPAGAGGELGGRGGEDGSGRADDRSGGDDSDREDDRSGRGGPDRDDDSDREDHRGERDDREGRDHEDRDREHSSRGDDEIEHDSSGPGSGEEHLARREDSSESGGNSGPGDGESSGSGSGSSGSELLKADLEPDGSGSSGSGSGKSDSDD